MKAPTYATIALSSLKRRRRQYATLMLGVALAIYFASAMLLLAGSIYEAYRARYVARYGAQDMIVFDDEEDRAGALFDGAIGRAGEVFVVGLLETKNASMGYYGEEAARMLGRVCLAGRMPEKGDEIAVEQSVLDALRLAATVGDSVTLSYFVPAGDDAWLTGVREETFTLVGILKEQSALQSFRDVGETSLARSMPGILICPTRGVEAGGRAVVHRTIQFDNALFSGGGFDRRVAQHAEGQFAYRWTRFSLFSNYDGGEMTMYIAVAAVLGSVLVAAACTGIVNAFTSALAERRVEIGMLRAVGATRRQIRRMFGGEALCIALLATPVSLALSCLTVWILSSCLRELFAPTWNPLFMLLTAALAMLTVLLAAEIPLRQAARVSPMQAIRETTALRARRRVRVRTRGEFRVPSLLARRHLSLYHNHRVGISVIVSLNLLLLSVGFFAAQAVSGGYEAYYDFTLEARDAFFYRDDAFVQNNLGETLFTEGDVREARALRLAEEVDVFQVARVNLVLDEVSDYVKGFAEASEYYFLLSEDEALAHYASSQSFITMNDWKYRRTEYEKLRAFLDTDKELVPVTLCALEPEAFARLQGAVSDGRIDLAAVNAGREVLLVAPSRYAVLYESGQYEEGGGWASIETDMGDEIRAFIQYTGVYENKQFLAGMSLPLCRLYTEADDFDAEDLSQVVREEAQCVVGAVLSEDVNDMKEFRNVGLGFLTVITTSEGMESLGFRSNGYAAIQLKLSQTPNAGEEEYIEEALVSIRNRVKNAYLSNAIASARENRRTNLLVGICMTALLILFFSICVSMVNNALTGRLRGDKRAIGTLRAVGAPLKVILSSYVQETALLLLTGVAGGLVLSAAFFVWVYFLNDPASFTGGTGRYLLFFGGLAALILGFLVLLLLTCGMNLRARLREIMRYSIVENIREL